MIANHFGGITGAFVAPAGNPYDQRALRPPNLDFDSRDSSQIPYSYHVYCVKVAVLVVSG
jgi:hypothetical protein